ncbi:MAG: hypothetical protein ABSG43_28900, partial [Solirubrobacteraceae bacterium]
GFAMAAVLHGLNDVFANASDWTVWVGVIAFSTLLFVAYATAGEAVEIAFFDCASPAVEDPCTAQTSESTVRGASNLPATGTIGA